MTAKPTLRFSAVGLNHPHIYGQVDLLLRAGAEFVSFYAQEPELIAEFAPRYPQAHSFLVSELALQAQPRRLGHLKNE